MNTNNAFLGARIRKTGETLSSQVARILKNYTSEIDPRAVPVLNILNEKKSASISEIADMVGFTHPAVIQLVSQLEKDELITINKSRSDKRFTVLELTSKGKDVFKKLEPVIVDIDEVIESMLSDIDANLAFSLSQLEKVLKDGSLIKKLNEKMKQKAMNESVIVPFKKKYKTNFKKINEEWLKKYFTIEEEDKRVLSNPEKEIIKKGGEIFFALLDDEVVGTCAMIKVDNVTFELAKMGVREKAQGKQIGKKLMLTSIGYAVERGARKIIVSTSPKLISAINLYKSIGFKRIDMAVNPAYKRQLFMMGLDLASD